MYTAYNDDDIYISTLESKSILCSSVTPQRPDNITAIIVVVCGGGRIRTRDCLITVKHADVDPPRLF